MSRAEYQKEYYQKNKERLKEYRQKNKERIAECGKEYRKENKERIAEYDKEYKQKNKERIAEYDKEYKQKNKERKAEYMKEYYQKNKERLAEYGKEYYRNRNKPTPEMYRFFSNKASKLKTKSRENKIPYDLDGKYLQSIYPEDGKCPALNIEMKAGSDSDWRLSPSVDRIDPSGGYIRGNVIWISWLANCIKTSATPKQIITVGEFYKQLEEESLTQ
jgi:hypothetical protein|tara:strand:+ start:18 stop:671 length:654 start_codon:yes stop_codon:yes gene_type:complete